MSSNLLRTRNFIVKPLALAVALGTVASVEVFAAESLALEEVVVTAQKRDENLQDVPISMAVLGSTALENLGVNGLEDFAALLPSMNYVSLGPGSGNIYMRGISSGGESILGANPNVAVYMDEQPVTAVGAFLNPHIYDIERIETLAGPQGTLFGANAQAGSIRIITKKPIVGEFSAGYDVEVNSIHKGDDGSLFEGFVNVPLGDNAAVRVVAWRKDEAGYIDNVAGSHTFDYQYIRDGLDAGGAAIATDKTITNEKYVEDNFNEATTTGFRGNVLIDLNENWTVTAGIMRQELESEGVWDHDPTDVGDLEVVRFNPDTNDDEWTQLSLVVEGKIGDMTLTYAGSNLDRDSYQQADYSLYADNRLSPGATSTYYSCYVAATGVCGDPSILFTADNEYKRENHEIRLVSSQESRLRWIVGAFYEEASHDFDLEWHIPSIEGLIGTIYDGSVLPIAVEAPDIYWTTDQKRSNEEKAVFGEISFDITEDLTVAYSTRYFDFDSQLVGFSGTFWWPNGRRGPRDVPFNTNLKSNDKDHVGKFNISYTVNDDVMVYGTWSEGYRPGGLNRAIDTPVGGEYAPDFLTSIEVGMKSVLMEGRLRLNAAIYTQEWDNFQLSKIDASVSPLSLTDNVGNATSDGLEFDGSFRVTENWNVDFGLSYIDSELTEDYQVDPLDISKGFAASGTELPRVPDVKWNISSRYNFRVMENDAFLQASYTHTGESYNLLYGTAASASATRSQQDAYQILNLAVGVETDDWSAEIFVANATDERGEVFINGASYDQRITTNRPRTIGLRFRQMFN